MEQHYDGLLVCGMNVHSHVGKTRMNHPFGWSILPIYGDLGNVLFGFEPHESIVMSRISIVEGKILTGNHRFSN